MFPIKAVSKVDSIFPTTVKDFIPPYDAIPKEFKAWNGSRWELQFVQDAFYRGMINIKTLPKDGVDSDAAMAHIRYVLGSWEPKHEHKVAGVAFLLNDWFEIVTWDVPAKAAT